MERRLAAILAADVVGYSRLMGEDEVGTLARLQSCRPELVDLAMHRIRDAYAADASAPNLLLHQFFRDAVKKAEPNWRKMAALAVECGVPIPAFSSALAYYDGMRRARGPANLLQGLRDYFGAHTYARLDRPGKFHTQWAQDGTEVPVAAREK